LPYPPGAPSCSDGKMATVFTILSAHCPSSSSCRQLSFGSHGVPVFVRNWIRIAAMWIRAVANLRHSASSGKNQVVVIA
jgi:hypothetical protein